MNINSYEIDIINVKNECNLQVPQKFRYPFFTEMLWYVLDRYVSALLGRSHLVAEGGLPAPAPALAPPKDHVHLTQNELHGLKVTLIYILFGNAPILHHQLRGVKWVFKNTWLLLS